MAEAPAEEEYTNHTISATTRMAPPITNALARMGFPPSATETSRTLEVTDSARPTSLRCRARPRLCIFGARSSTSLARCVTTARNHASQQVALPLHRGAEHLAFDPRGQGAYTQPSDGVTLQRVGCER